MLSAMPSTVITTFGRMSSLRPSMRTRDSRLYRLFRSDIQIVRFLFIGGESGDSRCNRFIRIAALAKHRSIMLQVLAKGTIPRHVLSIFWFVIVGVICHKKKSFRLVMAVAG
jgi:hypothetical protein